MRGHHRDRRDFVQPGLFLHGTRWVSTLEHADGEPFRVEHFQSVDAARHRPLPTMRNNLPALRAERGWTQGELAAELHVSRQTVNAIETERYEPSLALTGATSAWFKRPI